MECHFDNFFEVLGLNLFLFENQPSFNFAPFLLKNGCYVLSNKLADHVSKSAMAIGNTEQPLLESV